MKRRQALTCLEALLLVALLLVALLFVGGVRALDRAREPARRIRCRNNLNQFAKGMATYLNEYGESKWYSCPLGRGLGPDDFSGAEWLASLYWTRVLPDPGVYICPSSPDTNDSGADLGAHHAIAGRFSSQTVSYAGMHYYSLTDDAGNPKPAAISADFPRHPAVEPMGSDDTEGTVSRGRPSKGGMSVLFFDSHIEFWTHKKIDLERGVGMKGGPLWRLRN